MTEMDRALEADGAKLRQLTGEDHGPFESVAEALGDPVIGPSIQSLAILIAVEIAKQDNELDNLGDGESVVLVGKCPTINLVQLAERIDEHYRSLPNMLTTQIATLEAEIVTLANQVMEASRT